MAIGKNWRFTGDWLESRFIVIEPPLNFFECLTSKIGGVSVKVNEICHCHTSDMMLEFSKYQI